MEYLKCPLCGGELIWGNDEMASDVIGGDYENDDDALISFYTCSVCGRMFDIIDPTEEEKSKLSYWNHA